MNLTKNFASRCHSWRDSRQDRAEICFLVRFVVGFRQDFGRRDYCFPARILARFVALSRHKSRQDPAGSHQDPGHYFTRVDILETEIFSLFLKISIHMFHIQFLLAFSLSTENTIQ